jgi:hypothetical protein
MNKILEFLYKYLTVIVFVVLEVLAFLLVVNKNDLQRSIAFRYATTLSAWTYGIANSVTDYFGLVEINKNLALSEYYLNDGEVEESKNALKRATQTLKTCIQDCFEELKEEYSLELPDVDEDPSVCNLIAYLSEFASGCLLLLNSELSSNTQMTEIGKNKVKVALAKVEDLTNKLFD